MEWVYPPRRGYYVHIINLSSHGISMYIRYICPFCRDIIQARFYQYMSIWNICRFALIIQIQYEKTIHQQVNWANNLRQLYCHLRQTVRYLHNRFNCLEMTPAALQCQLIAVELCNLETTVFFNPLSLSMAHPWCVAASGTLNMLKEDVIFSIGRQGE